MAFETGRKKTGGRKKGSLNRRNLQVHEKAAELGVDPFEILLRFATGDWKGLGYKSDTVVKYSHGNPYKTDRITADHRLKAASEACQYLHPKRKAIERHDANKKKDKFRNVPNEELTAIARREFKDGKK